MGEFLTDRFMNLRQQYPKSDPMNELYKLFTNTTYGVTVSPFFTVSNVILAQNITGRIRTAIWLHEKALNTLQSITDGGILNLNRVYWPPKPGIAKTVALPYLYRASTREMTMNRWGKIAPLFGKPATLAVDGDDLVMRVGNREWRQDYDATSGAVYTAITDEIAAHIRRVWPDHPLVSGTFRRLKKFSDPASVPAQPEYVEGVGLFTYETEASRQGSNNARRSRLSADRS